MFIWNYGNTTHLLPEPKWLEKEDHSNFWTFHRLPTNVKSLEIDQGSIRVFFLVRISDGCNIWWEKIQQSVELIDRDVDELRFKQRGFRMDVHSTHPAKMVSECFSNKMILLIYPLFVSAF